MLVSNDLDLVLATSCPRGLQDTRLELSLGLVAIPGIRSRYFSDCLKAAAQEAHSAASP